MVDTSKIRINDLARELEVKSKVILDSLTAVGVTEKKTHSSSITVEEAEKVRAHVKGGSAPAASRAASRAHGDEIKTNHDTYRKGDDNSYHKVGDGVLWSEDLHGNPAPAAFR